MRGFARLGEIDVPAIMLLGDLEYPMVSQASGVIQRSSTTAGKSWCQAPATCCHCATPLRLAQAISEVAG
jgi:hypothetical protein